MNDKTSIAVGGLIGIAVTIGCYILGRCFRGLYEKRKRLKASEAGETVEEAEVPKKAAA